MSRAQIWMLGALLLGGTLPVRAQTAQWATGAYVYDGAGNIKSIGNTEQYRYDASGRLTSGTIATGQTQTVTYDPYGNIKTITTAGLALAVGVDPATNRATQTHEAQTNTAYNVYATYDLAGRLTSALNGAGGTYSYDALDSVMKSTGNGVTKVHWYTASDERIASVAVVNNNGTWLETESEWTLRDPSGKVLRRLQKTGTQWTWKEDYIYAGSQLLAAETDTPARTLHFFPDHLGTARLITANGGTKVAFHTYYPFGDEATASSQDSEKLKFTGHERDAANLDYMHARYYAPKWGRFLSPDPVLNLEKAMRQPQNWNRYAYVMNNPINRIDPDGRDDGMVGLTVMQDCQLNDCRPDWEEDKKTVKAGLFAASLFLPGPEDAVFLAFAVSRVALAARIGMAARSASAGIRFQAEVAEQLGGLVLKFGKEIRAGGKRLGEIDIETSKAIIDTTITSKGKAGDIAKYVTDKRINPEGKVVIVYGPNLTRGAGRAIEKTGAKVFRNIDDLNKYLSSMR